MSQGALVDSTRDDPTVTQLRKTTRWHEVFCPVDNRSQAPQAAYRRRRTATWAPTGFYCASLYGRSNADSSDLFRQAAAAAARVGNAPYFICMDANIDIRCHPVLLQLLR